MLLTIFWKFNFPPFMVLVIAALNDGTIMTISKDRVKPSPMPNSWKLSEIFATGVVLGAYMALMTAVFFWAAYETNFFAEHFHVKNFNMHHYNMSNREEAKALNEMMASAVYLQVSTINQALIFVTRSRGWSFTERPGLLLIIAFILAQLDKGFAIMETIVGGCFFIGMDKDDAIKILDACGFFPEIGISNLRERCLLKIDWSNKLHMHNLIRDMGREIVREESVKNPRNRSRLWFHEDAFDVLKNFKGQYENIEGIRLVMPTEKKVDISTRAFHSLPNLRLLQISNVNLTGSFENLFEELRWFCWNYSSLDCLPSSFQAPKLTFLDMQHNKVKILWEGTKQLQSLKVLNASKSRFLKTTPDFKGLESLEKLMLGDCSSLSQIHPSIGLLHKLVHLHLYGCDGLHQLPEQLGNMRCLRKLDVSWSSIEQLPDSIGHLGKLKELDLVGCNKLRNLPSSICDLTSLVYLRLRFCSNLESLPENFGNLTSLACLSLYSTNIMQLPDSIECLTRLIYLDMSHCRRLRNTPRSIYNLSSLQSLIVCGWPYGDNLYGIESLSSLKKLWLSYKYFNSLPSNLEELYVTQCSSLQSLPNLSRMNNLTTLVLSKCSSLQSLRKLPPNLRILNLDECCSLQFLPELPLSLQTLALKNCTSLQSLPKIPPNLFDYRYPKRKRSSDLHYNLNLENFSSLQSIQQLPLHLHILNLNNCSSLESLPELPLDLLKLYLNNNTSLKSLPELPTNLIRLELRNCTSLESLPELPHDLRQLYLSNCTSLESLPELPHDLKKLDLSNCNRLKSLPKLPPNLEGIRLTNCTSLGSLPKLTCKLRYLGLTGCSNLRSLFPNIVEQLHQSQITPRT